MDLRVRQACLYKKCFDMFVIFLRDFILIPGVPGAIFGIFPYRLSEKWPARQPAAGPGPGSRVAGTGLENQYRK